MKKRFWLIVLVCMMLSIPIAGCAKNSSEPTPDSAGGYTADRELSEKDLSLFEQVMAEVVGVGYEPTLVATQVVAGTNYRFTATATPVTPDAEPYSVYVYIFVPLDGEPELTEIVNID